MKHSIVALLILAMILTGSYFSISYTKNISNDLLHTLSSCESEVILDNWESAVEYITISSSIWKTARTRLALLLSHRNLDEISDLFEKVKSLVDLKEKNAYLTENKRLTALVKNLGYADAPTFENLF